MTAVRSCAGCRIRCQRRSARREQCAGSTVAEPVRRSSGCGDASPQLECQLRARRTQLQAYCFSAGIHSQAEAVGAAVGAVATAIVVSYSFGDVQAERKGSPRGLRRSINRRAVPKPTQSLVKGAGPIAKALAGRRAFPLWAVLHHRGRGNGLNYQLRSPWCRQRILRTSVLNRSAVGSETELGAQFLALPETRPRLERCPALDDFAPHHRTHEPTNPGQDSAPLPIIRAEYEPP